MSTLKMVPQPIANDTISLCMIVKNEASRLTPCLASIKSEVDEIVIVDTGSTDDTVNIAKRFTPNVYHFKQEHFSFSKARNESIRQATGNIILILDADEYISSERGTLREFVKQNMLKPEVVAATVVISTDMHNRTVKQKQSIPAVRLFKNFPDIRYRSRVHEQVDLSKYRDKKILSSGIEITHTGYSSWDTVKSKTERNIVLLRDDYKKDPNNFNTTFQLANSYGTLGDQDKSAEYCFKTIENPKSIPSINASCYNVLASNAMYKKDLGSALDYVKKSLEIANHQQMARYLKATIHEMNGQISLMLETMGELHTLVFFGHFVYPGVKPAFDINMAPDELTQIYESLLSQLSKQKVNSESVVNVSH